MNKVRGFICLLQLPFFSWHQSDHWDVNAFFM